MPGCEAKLVCILTPGISLTALGNNCTKMRIRQHIHPWCGRHLCGCGSNDVFVPVRGKTAQPIVQNQIAPRQHATGWKIGAAASAWPETRHLYIPDATVINLFRQRSPAVSYDGTCDRLEQNTIFV